MYEDELRYKTGEVQKRKIVESNEFSVDERISIISEIFVIIKKEEPDIT
jgi:transposase